MTDTVLTKSILENVWKILIIDDDEDDFIIARSMLKEARGQRFDVHWASTYTDGQKELNNNCRPSTDRRDVSIGTFNRSKNVP